MLPSCLHPAIGGSRPPSRYDNPFATCWTRPGAIPFLFSAGQCADSLVSKLAATSWWGAVVGPHGSGKSTLLETLKPALVAKGRRLVTISLHDREHRLPSGFVRAIGNEKWAGGEPSNPSICRDFAATSSAEVGQPLIIIDGFDQLAWLERFRLMRHCRRGGAGLLVTVHREIGIPALIHVAPDRHLIEQLVADLCAKVSTPMSAIDVTASHACHGSNVREIFFDLYDRFERRRRAMRTDGRIAT
jgi:energy-coupling factor transporter ATP-binding protein EcfA2